MRHARGGPQRVVLDSSRPARNEPQGRRSSDSDRSLNLSRSRGHSAYTLRPWPLRDFRIRRPPRRPNAPAVSRLRAAGAILIGKTNTPELTLAYETDNIVYGRTNNPFDAARTCGGSSGGAAAIIAAGGSPLDIGSDTGGSIRFPSHCC